MKNDYTTKLVHDKFNDLRIGEQLKILGSCIETFLGVSNAGRKRITFRFHELKMSLKSTQSLKVQLFSQDEYNLLSIDLENDTAEGVFYVFCADIISAIAIGESEPSGSRILSERYLMWVKIFEPLHDDFSQEREMGLLGELYFLEHYIAKKYGFSLALEGWGGPDLDNKDFTINNAWYEVKTISLGMASVKISSVGQLSAQEAGQLIVVRVEKMSLAYKGAEHTESVRSLIDSMLEHLSCDASLQSILLEKLVSLGVPLFKQNWNRYRIDSISFYNVKDGFPRIQVRDVKYHEISNVQYALIVNMLGKYETKDLL